VPEHGYRIRVPVPPYRLTVRRTAMQLGGTFAEILHVSAAPEPFKILRIS